MLRHKKLMLRHRKLMLRHNKELKAEISVVTIKVAK